MQKKTSYKNSQFEDMNIILKKMNVNAAGILERQVEQPFSATGNLSGIAHMWQPGPGLALCAFIALIII